MIVTIDERVLHFNFHSNSIVTKISTRSIRNRVFTNKVRLNEIWDDFNNWNKIAIAIVNESFYEQLCALFEKLYCRSMFVFKQKELYDYDFNSKDDVKKLIKFATIYSIKVRVFIDEKFLNFKKVIIELFAKQFKKVIDVEMIAHKKMKTYKRVKRFNFSLNTKIFTFKLVYKIKKNFNDEIKKFKTRWCARDFEQSFNLNFYETYAFVVKTTSYKIIFVVVAHENLKIEQMNIIIAFLMQFLSNVTFT